MGTIDKTPSSFPAPVAPQVCDDSLEVMLSVKFLALVLSATLSSFVKWSRLGCLFKQYSHDTFLLQSLIRWPYVKHEKDRPFPLRNSILSL